MICVLNWGPADHLPNHWDRLLLPEAAWFRTRGTAAPDWVFGDPPVGRFEVYYPSREDDYITNTIRHELHGTSSTGEDSTTSFAALAVIPAVPATIRKGHAEHQT